MAITTARVMKPGTLDQKLRMVAIVASWFAIGAFTLSTVQATLFPDHVPEIVAALVGGGLASIAALLLKAS